MALSSKDIDRYKRILDGMTDHQRALYKGDSPAFGAQRVCCPGCGEVQRYQYQGSRIKNAWCNGCLSIKEGVTYEQQLRDLRVIADGWRRGKGAYDFGTFPMPEEPEEEIDPELGETSL